jgi:small subunit ribosomal protein S5
VPEAIRKATEEAKKTMIRVPLKEGRTLHHDQEGRHGAGKIIMRAAPPGTGIIAGGPMRAVFEMLGVQDVVAKSQGTQNPYNMIRATFEALRSRRARVRSRRAAARRSPTSCPSATRRRLTGRGRRARSGGSVRERDGMARPSSSSRSARRSAARPSSARRWSASA